MAHASAVQSHYRFEDGVPELVAWVAEQQGLAVPSANEVDSQLEAYGLLR